MPRHPSVNDIDSNIYNTVQIGDQCRMKENLKTTTYNNGRPIPNVTDPGLSATKLVLDLKIKISYLNVEMQKSKTNGVSFAKLLEINFY